MVLFTPKYFSQPDFERSLDVIREMPLATMFSASSGYLSKEVSTEITHLPFTIRSYNEETQEVTLISHIAKDNDHVALLEQCGSCVLVFQGKHDSYVSAAWYEQKQINHKIVSTWDYATVHCWCEVKIIREGELIMDVLRESVNNFESMRGHNGQKELIEKKWEVDEAPKEYLDALMRGIVGLELKVTRMESKFKMNQNKPARDVKKIIEGYKAEVGGEKAEYLISTMKREHPKKAEL